MAGIQSNALQSTVFRAATVLGFTSRACFDTLMWSTEVIIISADFCFQRLVSFKTDPPRSFKLYLHQKETILCKGVCVHIPFFFFLSHLCIGVCCVKFLNSVGQTTSIWKRLCTLLMTFMSRTLMVSSELLNFCKLNAGTVLSAAHRCLSYSE